MQRLLSLALVLSIAWCAPRPKLSACEQRAPSWLTLPQKSALCAGVAADSVANALCAKAASQRLAFPVLLVLCTGAPGTGPSDRISQQPPACYKAASSCSALRGPKGEPLRAALCAGARDTKPAKCAAALASSTKPTTMVLLCAGAATTAPARCFRAVKDTSGMRAELKVELCQTAQLGKDLDGGDAATLPARCVGHSALRRLRGMTGSATRQKGGKAAEEHAAARARVRLCRGATSLQPVACVGAAPSFLSAPERLALCAAATDDGPARCAAAAAPACKSSGGSGSSLSASHVVALCRGAADTGPGECMAAAPRGLAHPMPSSGTHATRKSRAAESESAAQSTIVSLCTGAPAGAGPAKCLAALRGALAKLHKPDVAAAMVRLCRSATGTAPALCANAAPFTLSPSLKAAVCTGVRAGIGPAQCAEELGRDGGGGAAALPPKALARLCNGAHDAAPARCYNAARRGDGGAVLPPIGLADLCRYDDDGGGGGNTAGAVAAREARPSPELAAVCANTLPAGMLAGAVSGERRARATGTRRRKTGGAAADKSGDGEEGEEQEGEEVWRAVVLLCRGARTAAPARCAFAPSIRGLGFTWRQRAMLCAGARDDLDGSGVSTEAATKAAKAGKRTKHSTPRKSSSTATTLSPRWAAPADCAALANRGGASGGGNEGPFDTEHRVALCTGAESTMPAKCAHELIPAFSHKQRVALCSGAKALTVAHCANSAANAPSAGPHVPPLPLAAVRRCRRVRAIADSLAIHGMESDAGPENPLLPSSNITVVLRIFDQFGQPFDGEVPIGLGGLDIGGDRLRSTGTEPLRVRVSVNQKGSDGARVIGSKVVAADSYGFVRFENFRMSLPGNFTLQFNPASAPDEDRVVDENSEESDDAKGRTADEQRKAATRRGRVAGAVLYLSVATPVLERSCDEMYEQLQSFATGAAAVAATAAATAAAGLAEGARSNEGAEDTRGRQRGQHMAQMQARIPPHLAIPLLGLCGAFLRDSGATFVWAPNARGGLPWLTIRSSAWKLLRNVGLPKPAQDLWERLGLVATDFATGGLGSRQIVAMIRRVKRTYHSHSLEWHPDRWVTMPLAMQVKAAHVFSLVSEAYAGINKRLVTQQRAAERLEVHGDSTGGEDDGPPETILIGYGRVGCTSGSHRCRFAR